MVSYAMSVMNDRPLTYVFSDNLSEGTTLTPSMLMHGYKLLEPPHLNLRKPVGESELKLSDKYKFLEKLKDSWWNFWQENYLTSLFERHSTQGKCPSNPKIPKIGDIVLIRGEKLPRREWKVGRILDVKYGRDKKIRECKVQTLSKKGRKTEGNFSQQILNRSPSFLVPLEGEPEYYASDPMMKVRSVKVHTTPRKTVRFQV